MFDYKKNQHANIVPRFIAAGIGTLALFLVAVITSHAAWQMYNKFTTASAAADAAKQEQTELEAQKASVGQAIEELSTPRGVEAHLRERFGVAKPGEGEIRIIRGDDMDGFTPFENEKNILTRVFEALFVW